MMSATRKYEYLDKLFSMLFLFLRVLFIVGTVLSIQNSNIFLPFAIFVTIWGFMTFAVLMYIIKNDERGLGNEKTKQTCKTKKR